MIVPCHPELGYTRTALGTPSRWGRPEVLALLRLHPLRHVSSGLAWIGPRPPAVHHEGIEDRTDGPSLTRHHERQFQANDSFTAWGLPGSVSAADVECGSNGNADAGLVRGFG